jgi:hypothetical protein
MPIEQRLYASAMFCTLFVGILIYKVLSFSLTLVDSVIIIAGLTAFSGGFLLDVMRYRKQGKREH